MFRTKITTMLYNFSLAKKQTMFECNKFDRANSRVPKKVQKRNIEGNLFI
jgi:hypothetical protein